MMKLLMNRFFRTALVLALGFETTPGLWANEATADLDEVVISGESAYRPKKATTATKTDTPLRDIPAAVVVVPKEVLADQGVANMNQAVSNISGVAPVMGGGYGFADNYVMRGLRMRFLRDGLSDGPSFNGYARTMTDVERLEALKGPGSALYGRNEPGGVINVTTKQPLDSFGLAVEGMVGSFGAYRTAVDVGGPLSSSLPTRLNAAYYHTDGFRDLEKNITEVLPTVSWKANDKNMFTLDYDFRDIEIVPDNYGILFKPNGELVPVDRDTKYYSLFNNTNQEINRVSLSHKVELASPFSLRSSLLYDSRDLYLLRNAGGSVNASNQSTGRTAREQTDDAYSFLYQTEAVANVKTGGVSHVILAGVEIEQSKNDTKRDDFTLPNIANVLNPVIPETSLSGLTKTLQFDRTVKSNTLGVYGQEQIALTDKIKARGGVRLDQVNFSDDGVSRISGTLQQRNLSSVQNLVSWQAGAVYQPWTPASFYGGYSAGKFLNIQTESSLLTKEPEESSQIEGGVKTSFLDDRLQANVAVFQTTRKNYYVTLVAGGESQPVGEQETNGIEIDLIGSPMPGLNITANHAIFDAKIESKELSGSTSISGKQPQAVPDYSGSLWVAYEIQSGKLKGFGVGGGPTWKGVAFADALNVFKVPSYVIGNAALFYRRPKWEAQINVNNVTDEEYFATPTFSGALPGDPRSVYASVKIKI